MTIFRCTSGSYRAVYRLHAAGSDAVSEAWNTAPSREELESRYTETAIRAIKRQRILDYVAAKENIKATQEDVDKEIQRLVEIYNHPFEELKQTFRKTDYAENP